MATQYLLFNTRTLAKTQSQNWWLSVLGRAINAGDVTQFLVAVLTSQITNKSLAVADDASVALVFPLLDAAQQNFFNTNALQANDPVVIAFLAEQPPPLI